VTATLQGKARKRLAGAHAHIAAELWTRAVRRNDQSGVRTMKMRPAATVTSCRHGRDRRARSAREVRETQGDTGHGRSMEGGLERRSVRRIFPFT
jgi:hypothetical protein